MSIEPQTPQPIQAPSRLLTTEAKTQPRSVKPLSPSPRFRKDFMLFQVLRPRKLKLLEIEKEWPIVLDDILSMPKGGYRYARERRLYLKRKINKIPLKKLVASISKLQKGEKTKDYYMAMGKVGKKSYYVFGRLELADRDVPIWYQPDKGKFYISKSSARQSRKMVSTAIMYRLSGLGVPYRIQIISSERLN